ncbi:MAG: hypothetical protein D6798_20970 [Deltaproteobacteria bacterium]|nr:MAG: hypothetical protein D6798_20970 [Deltaproteobacteria bacterium]
MWLGRLLLSVAVLAWLGHDVDTGQVAAVARAADWRILVVAFGLKLASLLLHEVRTWLPLPRPRPPLVPVVATCLGVGMLNLVLPGRAGDLGIIAALHRRFGVPPGTATAVVGVTGFIEAAVFGILLVAVLATSLLGVPGVVDTAHRTRTLAALAGGAGLAAVSIGVAVRAGRWLADRPAPTGVVGILHRALVDTAALLTNPREMAANISLALVQTGLMVAAFAAGLPAVGFDDLPALATAGAVLAISSLAGLLLPPTWGLGPAAASRLVLTAAGHGPEDALVYAGAYWLIAHLPVLAVGLPALWWRGGGGDAGT